MKSLGLTFFCLLLMNGLTAQTTCGTASTNTFSVTSDANGIVTAIALPIRVSSSIPTLTIQYIYNTSGQISQINRGLSILSTYNITAYDANGFPSAGNSNSGGNNYTATFNSAGQPILETISSGGSSNTFAYTYSGNNLTQVISTLIVGTGTPLTSTGNCPFSSGNPSISTGVPIPTMSQWGLLIFGLLIMNLGVFYVQRRELV